MDWLGETAGAVAERRNGLTRGNEVERGGIDAVLVLLAVGKREKVGELGNEGEVALRGDLARHSSSSSCIRLFNQPHRYTDAYLPSQ